MSDSVTWFVDLEASLDEAKEMADHVSNWLIAQGIVSPIPCQALRADHLLSRGELEAQWDVFEHIYPAEMCGLKVVIEQAVLHRTQVDRAVHLTPRRGTGQHHAGQVAPCIPGCHGLVRLPSA